VTTIEQLSADRLAQYASALYQRHGRNRLGARLIYRALELEPRNAAALRGLSDLLDKSTKPFAAAALEYAIDRKSEISAEDKSAIEELLFSAKHSWGFSRHLGGGTNLTPDDFRDRAAFKVDSGKYRSFLDKAVRPARSLENAVRSARILCGLIGGIVEHRSKGQKVQIADTYRHGEFKRSAAYTEFLRSSADTLEAMATKPVATEQLNDSELGATP
jgi:hypothetical protein